MSIPDFMIIGSEKAGMTSLFNYLKARPDITYQRPPQFFHQHWEKGQEWFEQQLPKAKNLLGYGSGDDYAYPTSPARIKSLYPNIKMIMLLRNPIDRAYSHYCHNRRLAGKRPYGEKNVSFEDRIYMEDSIVGKELVKFQDEENYKGTQFFMVQSYLHRGKYGMLLEPWLELFKREQFMFIQSEQFFSDTNWIFSKVLDFIGAREMVQAQQFRAWNPGGYATMKPDTRRWLREYFRPHNAILYDLIGANYDWK